VSTTLATHPVEEPDLLALIADELTPLGIDLADAFRDACWAEALANNGLIHPCRVTARLVERDPAVNKQRISAMWSTAAKRDGGYLDNTDVSAQIDGTVSKGNGNKSTTYRLWRGWVGGAE